MTAPIDRAYVEILPDLRKFAPQMKTQVAQAMRPLSATVGAEYRKTTGVVAAETAKMSKATRAVADETKRGVSGIGASIGAVAGLAAGALVKGFLDAAEQQRKANMQTAAVIKSTGGAAHVTASQIEELSGNLSKQTGIEDDVIQASANMLLTFTNVRNEVGKGNDIFDQATKVVTDMSVALGEDGKSAAIQLGKALNDPIKGVTALQRVGVTFTQAQKDQIKVMIQTGDTLGAQKIILGELNKEFGGSAIAQASASDKMRASWHQLQESVGTALLPIMDALATIAGGILDTFSQWAPVLTPVILVVGGLATAAWLVHAGMKAWAAVTADISKILDVFKPKVVAQTVANEALAESEVAAGAAGKGMLGGMAAFAVQAGPIVAIAAGLTFGLSKLYDATNAFGDSLAGKTLSGIKDLDKVLQANGGSFDAQAQKVLAATLVQNGYVEKLGKAGISASDLTSAVTGSDEAFKGLIQRWKDGGSPANDTIFSLQRIHDHFRDSTVAGQDNAKTLKQVADAAGNMHDAVGSASNALQEQQKFLNDNNLTVDQATKKYRDAVAEATSFTAQLGYMSAALDQLSNNAITATLQQDQLNTTMGTSADKFAGSKAQVAAHGTALQGNTSNAISNRDWALQQIQAINQQGVSFAQSTGKVSEGTRVIGLNTGALRESMRQAGFTTSQIDTLINKYAATPQQIQTLVTQKGQEAIVQKLGDMVNLLQQIADPAGWSAKVNLQFQQLNTSMPLHARGGRIGGSGGPTEDNHVVGVSTGEYIVNAADTARNLAVLQAINNGLQVKGFATGGLVGVPGIGNRNGVTGNLNGIIGNLGAGGLNAALRLGLVGSGFPSGPQAWRDKVDAVISSYVSKLPISNLGGPSTAGGSLGAWIAAALAITGTPGSWGAAIQRRIMFESGGNPSAINNWDSNAAAGDPSKGLMQTIGATFAAYHQPGTSFNIYDPIANIAAAINYIKARYGTIFSIDPPVQGYGNGGPVNRTGLIFAHQGEEVLNRADAQKYRAQPAMVELGPRSIAAIATAVTQMVIEMDGRQVATVVSKHQNAWDIRGQRR